jgi:hypothetical protein
MRFENTFLEVIATVQVLPGTCRRHAGPEGQPVRFD